MLPEKPCPSAAAGHKMNRMSKAEVIERLLARPDLRRLFRWMTDNGPSGGPGDRGGRSRLARFFKAYADGTASWWRPEFAVPYLVTEVFRRAAGASRETLRTRVFGNPATRRGLVATVRSVGHLGLSKPQQFVAPFMVVWNFTQACNLRCKHCYQEAGRRADDELTLEEQKQIVDILADHDVAMLALSGGEPLMSPTLLEVARYASDRDIHVTVATNGTLLTPEKVEAIARAGIRYAEISLDSVDPARHDAFRGGKGYWEAAVRGIRNVVRHGGMRCGVAMTVTRWNLDELQDMLEWCIAEGVSTFYAFNFIPTGRALGATDQDLSPEERERMLAILQKYLVGGRISIMCTAPQYGRACLEFGGPDSPVNTGHYGYGGGRATRVLAKYVGGCGAGRCYMALQPNGDVTPCVFLPIKVGNLRTDPFQTIWNHPVMRLVRDREARTGHCKVCEYRYHCGGCLARSHGYFGDLRRADPGCKFNLAEWQEVLASAAPAPAGTVPLIRERGPSL